MARVSWRPCLLAAALAVGPLPPAFAIDLLQSWQAALANDPQFRAARAAADAARERVPQARAQLLPQVSASSQRYWNDLRSEQLNAQGRVISTDRDRYTSTADALTLRQPLFRPGLMAQLRQARAAANQGESQLQTEQVRLAARVAEAYLEVLRAQEQVRLVEQQRGVLATQLDAARKAFAAGSGTRTDIDEAQSRIDINLALELEARQAVEIARRQLSAITGEPSTTVSPVAVERLPTTAQQTSVDEWVARAQAASPEVHAARSAVEAAQEAVDVAQAEHFPTLDGIAQVLRNENDNPTRVNSRYNQRQIGVQLSVPIFEGGGTSSRVRQAQAEAQRTEGLLRATELDVANRVHREYRGVTEGFARIRALEQAVRSNEQLVVSSRRSYEAGARTLLDILNAEQQLGSVRRDLAQARFAFLAALVRLRTLAGEPAEATIVEVNGWLAR
jgi:outer membrane protein/protease secretion system outer membrane protein